MSARTLPFSELLSQIIDNRGKTCPTADSGMPLIATNCIKNTHLYPVFEKVRYVDKETYSNWFRGHPHPGDIIFVTKGSPGQTSWVQDPVSFCIAQDMVSLRVNKSIVYPKYLLALLRTNKVQKQIEGLHVGTLIPHFKKGDFDKLLLDIPENYEEQVSIGDLYFLMSSKIELNLEINKTLEEMAMAIYKEWFVDFGPYKDGEFVESELGMIPKGWSVGRLGDAVNTLGGGTPKTSVKEYWENGTITWYSPTDLTKARSLFSNGSEKKITELGLNKSSAKLFPPYSVLMTSRATIGEITINRMEASTNQGFITMIPNDKISIFQLVGWIIQNMKTIRSIADGSTFPEISKGELRDFKILIGSRLDRYIEMNSSIFKMIENNIVENQLLIEIRDYLLPKLINGEKRIKEAEEEVEKIV